MEFNIVVANKIATVDGETPTLICGNNSYVINFVFDAEWEEYQIKTAVFTFKRNGQTKFIEVLFTGTKCNVPVLSGIDEVNIGVYAGELKTTTGAIVPCQKSVLCDVSKVEDPPKNFYSQLLEILNNNYPLEAGISANEAAGSANAAAEQTAELNKQLNEFINDTRNSIEEIFASVMAGKTLWENTDTSIEFAAQTIELDLSGYKKICIVFENSNTYSDWMSSVKGQTYEVHETDHSNGTSIRSREYYFNDAGVTFSDAGYPGSSDSRRDNTKLIPVKIIAYKY